MKKVSVFIALFSLVFLMTSCGGGDENGGTTDPEKNSIPECSPSSETPCIDSETGLIWSAKSIERMSWEDALNYCKDYSEKDLSGWRLPDVNEWRTLIRNCSGSVTGGSCAVKDSECLSFDSCWSEEECRCVHHGRKIQQIRRYRLLLVFIRRCRIYRIRCCVDRRFR